MKKILVIEDVPSLRQLYQAVLRETGQPVFCAATVADGLTLFRRYRPDILILDLMLPDGDGLELLDSCLQLHPRCAVVVVTANRSVPIAVEAMRLGAYDFLVKPFDTAQLLGAVRNAAMGKPGDAQKPIDPGKPLERFFGFIGSSPAMQQVYARIRSVGRSMATVFITGEAGTGKDICARAIHSCSPRAARPFVRLRCSAIAPERQESELFGHLRGAFMGALSDHSGALRAADGGTLFIDDICDMDPQVQTKLLRFLQFGRFHPMGATDPIHVNLRLICATERSVEEEVRAGRFRRDLFHRLHIVPIRLPPLRLRGLDVIAIAEDALQHHAREEGKNFNGLSSAVQEAFLRHDWPGNLRQVASVMQNVAVLQEGTVVTPGMLPEDAGFVRAPVNGTEAVAETSVPTGDSDFVGLTLAEIERRVIEACIARHGGSVPQAARELDVAASTLYRKRAGWQGHAAD